MKRSLERRTQVKAKPGPNGWFFSTLILLLPGATLLVAAGAHALLAVGCNDWKPVDAVVSDLQTSTYVRFHHSSKTGTSAIEHLQVDRFEYQYQVQGTNYSSGRYFVLGFPPAAQMVKHLPPGTQITARYNPSNPAKAVVEVEPPKWWALMLSSGLMITAGWLAVSQFFKIGRTR